MILLWPFMLALLILIPVLLAVYIAIQRRRQRYALRYASLSLLKEAVGPGPGIRRHIPPSLFLLSLTAMIVALARPVAEVKVPAFDGTVILAIDVSGSMMASDLAPTRLAAAKSAARTFVAQQPGGVRIGVVAFSDFAALVQAPTSDKGAVEAAIGRLEPQRGTAIGQGLITAMKALDEVTNADVPAASSADTATPTPLPFAQGANNQGVIVLLSDGQNTTSIDPLEVAPQAKARGIRVFTVGIGTVEGTVLRIRGRALRVRLDEDTLRKVAEITNAQYFNAATEKDLSAIYQNLGRQFGLRTERTELTALVTGLAATLALAGGILSLLWFGRLP